MKDINRVLISLGSLFTTDPTVLPTSFHPVAEGGMFVLNSTASHVHGTWHWTDDMDSGLLVTCTHSCREENTRCQAGPHGAALGTLGGRLYSEWQEGEVILSTCRRTWLYYWIISHTGGEVIPIRWRPGLGVAGPVYDVGSLSCGVGGTSGESRKTHA